MRRRASPPLGPAARLLSPAPALVAAAVVALAGCGDSGESLVGSGAEPSASGRLAFALAERPRDLDPLLADSRAEQLVVRQVDEPLIASLTGPYADGGPRPGLAAGVNSSADATVWRLRLREGVRFHDGARLTASAVLRNVERWRTTAAGSALVPGLSAADAPRPDLVRLFFDRPVPELPELLSSPRLAIVSPRALAPRTGTAAKLRRLAGIGTGPFELRERASRSVLVARSVDWWGTPLGLGPALDQVEFRVVVDSSDRLALLRGGEVQVADRLAPPEVRALRRDPLLEAFPAPDGTALGLERSVRGIDSALDVPVLSDAWLTRIAAG